MRINLLSKRYAQAVFDLAGEFKLIDRVNADLLLVGQVLAENRQLKTVINNPVIDTYKKVKILELIFKKEVSELTMRFIVLITKKGRESYISTVCEAYHDIYQAYKNILSVEITTAVQLNDQLKKEVIAKMKKATDMEIDLLEKVKDDIVGGFVLKFKDYKYDTSIINELNKLREVFSHHHYIKKF